MEENQTLNRVRSAGSVVLDITEETESCSHAAAQAELTISQNVEAHQQFTQSPVPDIITFSPCPTSPISSHLPALDINSLFPDLSPGFYLTSPTYSESSTLLTPHPCPISSSSSKCSTPLPSPSWQTSQTSSPGPRLPTSSACPISSASSPIFSPFSSSPALLIPENINNPHVLHNQSSHDQQAKITFHNCQQASQLSQPVQSFTSQVGNTNTINSIAMESVIPITSSLKQEDLLSNRRDCAQQIQDTSLSQMHQNYLQFAHFNSQGYQHSNEMQQNTSLWGHQNPQSVQCSLQTHQQNLQDHHQNPQITQQNNLGSQQHLLGNPHMFQQNAEIDIQSQQNPPDPINFHQQPQQTLENHIQISWQSQNPHNIQPNDWQNLQTRLQHSLEPQQNLQTRLQHSLEPQQNLQTRLQHSLEPQQNLQTSPHNSLEPHQNLQTRLQHSLEPQQNLQTSPHNSLEPQQNLQTSLQHSLEPQQNLQTRLQHSLEPQQNLQTRLQHSLEPQQNLQTSPHNSLEPHQNLQTNQQNILQPQTNLKINQQNTWYHQHNFLSDQYYLCQPQINLQISQQTTLQPQENFQTNLQNPHQLEQTLQINEQNTFQPPQNTMQPQQSLLTHQQTPCQPQHTLWTSQQNPFLQPEQNLQRIQRNSYQSQQNNEINEQNTLQPHLNLQINKHNALLYQKNVWTNQQNLFQLEQNLQPIQQNPHHPQQNEQINQQNALQLQQNLQITQHTPYQLEQNTLTNEKNEFQPPQNLHNQQNTLQPLQNLHINQQLQQTLKTYHQNALQHQQYLLTNQQKPRQLQQNIELLQQNTWQIQQNLETNQQNAPQHQQNLLTNQQNPWQPQQNIELHQQNILQIQQTLETNQQDAPQLQQNLLISQQNPWQPQQNIELNQQNILQIQQALETNQQNSPQLRQNLLINQQSSWQPQQNIELNQQNTWQIQQTLETNQQDAPQLRQNLLTNQQNPWQPQQNIDLNQQNRQIQQNLETYQQNAPQLQQNFLTHQEDPYQLVQNLPVNQQRPYQPEQKTQGQQNVWPSQILQTSQPSSSVPLNLQTNQNNILKAMQNSDHTWQQQNQHCVHPYNQESGGELSIQQTQTVSNLHPLNRNMDMSLNHTAALISHQSGKVNKQMSSQMPPEHAVQTGCPTSSSCTELLKYVSRNQETAMEEETMQIPSQFSCWVGEFITQQLFPRPKSLVNINYMDIQNNQNYSHFLQELSTLGRLAASDLKKLQKNQRQHKSMLADKASDCDTSSRIPMETIQDMPAEEGQLLCQDNKWDDLITSANICHQKVKELASYIKQKAGEWLKDISDPCQQICKLCTFSDVFKTADLPNPEENLMTEMNEKSGCSGLLQHLSDVCGCLINFMEKWRGLEAWKYVQLTPTPDDMTVKTRYDQFGVMYITYFDCLSDAERRVARLKKILHDAVVRSNLRAAKQELYKIKFKLLSVSWYYVNQPPTCSLPSDKKDLRIRLFGVSCSDIDQENSEIYVFPQANYENRIHEQFLYKDSSIKLEECSSTSSASKHGVEVVVNIQSSINYKRRCESLCCEQLYRICLVIKLKTNLEQDIEPKIECCSLPFALRTGSSQLWEFKGAVMWHCYFEDNLYKPSPTFTKLSKIDQVVCMLQAVISTRDPQRILDKDEILSLKSMLKSVTHDRDVISLKEFAKDPLNPHVKQVPEQGRQPTKKQKQSIKQGRQATEEEKQPTKQGRESNRVGDQPRDTSKKCSFSFFGWFMAAVNSYMYLKSCKMSGHWFFLNRELCPAARDVPDGSALIRASRSVIEEPSGKNPYAYLTVHVYSGGRRKSYENDVCKLCTAAIIRVAVESILNKKPNAFIDWLELVVDKNNVQIIRTILPQNTPLEEFKDSSNEEEQTNNYRTRYKELPKSTIILPQQFEAMSLYADSDLSHHAESDLENSQLKLQRF